MSAKTPEMTPTTELTALIVDSVELPCTRTELLGLTYTTSFC